jgi:hypothetical protein
MKRAFQKEWNNKEKTENILEKIGFSRIREFEFQDSN